MPGRPFLLLISVALLPALAGQAAAGAAPTSVATAAAPGPKPDDLAGTWDLSRDRSGTRCRVMLRAERSDKGDYFLGMPPACRHAMPAIAKVGRWTLPGDGHLTLDDPAGQHVLVFAAMGDAYTATAEGSTYRLRRIAAAAPTASISDTPDAAADLSAPAPALVTRQPSPARAAAEAVRDKPADLAGRYAVMREKRDTGCMLTLDADTRAKAGGDRAQLAPGCRDQGIVIFDPVGWRLVRGELVLTARAGHTTRLDKVDDGSWAKVVEDGGKPLGLKKL